MLETYPQENMNTQAIRELTNEVFNLKNKAAINESYIKELEEKTKQKIVCGKASRENAIDVAPTTGTSGYVVPIPKTLTNGYTLIGFTITKCVSSSNYSIPLIVYGTTIRDTDTTIDITNLTEVTYSLKAVEYIAIYEQS